MNKVPLVSIITPCYNGENFVYRFFQSVLNQTYPNIELIFINDGSTDQTEEIACSFEPAFREKGISYIYIYQENAGQAAAVNRGLKCFNGEYLTWPDSDDWMADDCIEKKVAYLENHPDKGYVLCKTATVQESCLDKTISILQRSNTASGWLFDDLILENDVYFAPGGYMVRTKAFLEAIPSRTIYECKTGQNWQMLLPIAYRYECGYLDEILYFYLIRENSHSHSEKDYESLVEKTYRHQDTLVHVINDMELSPQERKKYLQKIAEKYLFKRFRIAAEYHQRPVLEQLYAEIELLGKKDWKVRLEYQYGRSRTLGIVYKVVKRNLKRILQRLGFLD